MAYLTANLHQVPMAGHAVNIWVYDSTDAAATVLASGYISDSYDRGMRVGDLVFVRQFTTTAFTALTALTMHSCSASVNGTGATLSAILTGGTSVLSVATASSPLVTSDSAAGYGVGSIWYNTTTKVMWICGSASAGAAVWNPVNTIVTLGQGLNLATTTIGFVAPFKYRIDKLYGVKRAAVGGSGSATLTCSIATTAVTDGVLTSVTAGAAGDVYSATPSALNTGAAGDYIKVVSSGSATGTDDVYIVLTQVM
jgi:hypothetical protein